MNMLKNVYMMDKNLENIYVKGKKNFFSGFRDIHFQELPFWDLFAKLARRKQVNIKSESWTLQSWTKIRRIQILS